jgi:hypothetical protein
MGKPAIYEWNGKLGSTTVAIVRLTIDRAKGYAQRISVPLVKFS